MENQVRRGPSKTPRPRNPIARAVRKIRPKVVPDKHRKLRERIDTRSETQG